MIDIEQDPASGQVWTRAWAQAEYQRDRALVTQTIKALEQFGLTTTVAVSEQDGQVQVQVREEVFHEEDPAVLRDRTEQVEDVLMALLGADLRMPHPYSCYHQRWAVSAVTIRRVPGRLVPGGAAGGSGQRLLAIQRERHQRGLPILGPGSARRFTRVPSHHRRSGER
ncbi:hypothetical protein [Actinomadura kijaniata]|uniref:hypothetical protein n=1 Tax=Actinomadura kijaniata TaxID=46161 RepID=UPI0008295FDB|nr:hypothetical protein [Actinomadura kijaniata]